MWGAPDVSKNKASLRGLTREPSNGGPVSGEQRFTADNPCPICDGSKDMPSGTGQRCFGFLSGDGKSVICTREPSDREAGNSEGWLHPVPDGGSAVTAPTVTRSKLGTPEATYHYTDEHGEALFEVVRFEGKQFRQRRPGSQTWGIGGVRLVPYRLPQVIAAAERGEIIYVVEGEKDADAVVAAGGVATCNPMGAGKWRDEYTAHFAGAKVVVVADRDDGPGLKHARAVRLSLLSVAASVEMAEATFGKDAADHLEAGFALDAFEAVPPRFQRVRLGDHVTVPAEWLFEPVLLAYAYTLMPAPAGGGKTMFTIAAMLSMVRAGKTVVYLDMENGPDVLKERAASVGYTDAEQNAIAYFPYPAPARDELAELVAEVSALKPDLVVFDAKANFSAQAGMDEDNSIDTTAWHQLVIQPLQRAGAAVLDLDHTGHAGERARGSSAKEAVAEASWYLSVDRTFDPDNTATLTLKRGMKNRRGVLPQELQYVIGGDGKGGFIFDPVKKTKPDDSERVARRRRMKEDIAKLVSKHWEEHGEALSMSAITKAVTGQRVEVSDAAQELGATPKSGFEIATGPRNAVLLRPSKGTS